MTDFDGLVSNIPVVFQDYHGIGRGAAISDYINVRLQFLKILGQLLFTLDGPKLFASEQFPEI
ncbi:hypothetical protein AB395_00002861 [Sinorhizobium fredii CCBAU 45436]|nr:hypothetical protein AB395_00002861 [Sinorhizobium fredii CCBAU 45436]